LLRVTITAKVFFGKWFANEGLTGIIPVIDTPSMVIIPKPGYSISEMARSLSLVVRYWRVMNGLTVWSTEPPG